MKPSGPETVITPIKGWQLPNIQEIFSHRDLLWFFVLRDIKVRYRQTALGVLWNILNPLLTMATMSLVFGRVLGLSSDGVPYPLFCFSGLILWSYFSQSISSATSSVINNVQLIDKVYFPRLIIPLAASLSGLLNLAISFALLLVLMPFFGIWPGLSVLLCIPIALLTTIFAVAVGTTLAALSVRFRDTMYLVPILLQLWLFASPVIYSASVIPEKWRAFFALNPLTGVIEMFRYVLIGTKTNPSTSFFISSALIMLALPVGLLIFRRLERSFADVI